MTHPMPEHAVTPAAMTALALMLVLVLLSAAAYAGGVAKLLRRGDSWPAPRTAAAAVGLACLGATLAPPLATDMTFPVHVVRHLLLAMVAPLALALSAPITLALRTLNARWRRSLLMIVHSWWARALTYAPVLLVLDIGGMAAFYLPPLYSRSHEHPLLGALVHAHMFLAGCLLNWYLVGRDPRPSSASSDSVRTRLLVLFLTAGSHDLLAKVMYAQDLPHDAGSLDQVRLGAQIMFYGGDVVELTLAAALLSAWYAHTGRQLEQVRRRGAGRLPVPARPARSTVQRQKQNGGSMRR